MVHRDKVQTYKWARMYMKQVGLTVLLQFQRATHEVSLYIHVNLGEAVYLFTYCSELDYAQNIPEYTACLGVWDRGLMTRPISDRPRSWSCSFGLVLVLVLYFWFCFQHCMCRQDAVWH